MMKRLFGVSLFICVVLGGAIGTWMTLAKFTSNISFVIMTIFGVIAFVLNVICGCGVDKKKCNKDEE